MNSPNEGRFESHIEKSLLKHDYKSRLYPEYDRVNCVIEEDLIGFIKETQEKEYQKLHSQFDTSTDKQLVKVLNDGISKRGIVDVLRKGINTRGCSFDLVYFQPKSGMNPEHMELYSKNRFVAVRQLHYSIKNEKSIDMVLFLNGIPIITMELKNQLTGQNIYNSEKQYKEDRNPLGEPLLQFKRCLVHFCVDNDKVSMTTRLSGLKTRFLPYNKGIENPSVKDDYRSEYLWNDILQPDSLLDIIENFVLVSIETDKVWSSKHNKVIEEKSEVLIFPRYHQLDVIRKLRSKIKEEGVGHNYLIQHTTGSGKSYSIGWLSHTLTSLYRTKGDTNRMFDTILVITDRKVLDRQLQNTLKQLEQTSGVVNPIDINSKQLQEYLEKGKDIIVTTIQKFPFISETISKLKGQTFGVVIDEVHSSQSGETSKHLKKSLSTEIIEDDDGEIDYEEMIRREIESRGKQEHISFFGFTGTPKNKTLELFGRKNEDGNFVPFHSYSMKQSIKEGFTLDVLEHYTTYKRYFKVHQSGDEDQELPESKVMKLLVDYVDSHDEVIKQKVSIILNQFVSRTSKKINGQARGMVVVRSRKHCVLFFQEMVRQMKERGLSYSCLVAFSGSVSLHGQDYTEGSLNSENGMEGSDIPSGLKDPRFRVLIVSNKFQTGFDEPLIHTMFVDKKLSGVQCVQTLSRLNRTKSGKTDTFVLDFVNDTEDIVNSFQPFYTSTTLTGETEPDKLYDLQYQIESFNLFTDDQVDRFCKEFYKETETDEKLHPIIDEVVESWKELETDDQRTEFKSKIQSFIRLYSYISQIITFTEVQWEKLYVFLRYVNKKLPKGESERIDLSDSVDLDSLRIQMMGESKLSLEDIQGEVYPMGEDGSGGVNEPEYDLLSHIIERINEVYGIELSEEDKLDLENVTQRMKQNDDLSSVMVGNNTEDDKKDFFKKVMKDEVSEYYGDRLEFYKKIMNTKVFPMILDGLYREYNRNSPNL
ncbi:type I restriction endonuclease subunit R [Aureitalea sp. L0-47]|uniref:type I restriction endonuclease subunit R n=1 Tax=Aureitalea sp. L0-47 TaxID=2816962 RepID=UPI0022378295|nr:DEAD/DEAH box helicase family protein [Aureitalea sp. L0-47]MCW5520180.1 type I restriction endonuclease subunit R [Aureitalea sp. L0-47]